MRKRIIREITPIFDTRALGYRSMLVAAKVDPEHPHRAARVINEHPGVSHNYLRDHEFNLWFTIAVEPNSALGLEGTLDVLARLSGASSMRMLPTLRLFKIRMDLEMEATTDGLAAPVEAVEPRDPEPVPLSDWDIAVIRATQGPMEACPRPFDRAAVRLGVGTDEVLASLVSTTRLGRRTLPLGGAAFNNEFGRPNLGGYFRVYEQNVGGQVRGYHKPVMIAGGIGNISDAHTHKHDVPAGSLLIQIGGPGMR
ncbi:MAG: hypothetical protein K6T27_09135, partial [Thermoleophilum sp.]|nr:hypothetical protein [Thermoleophilum sp.]